MKNFIWMIICFLGMGACAKNSQLGVDETVTSEPEDIQEQQREDSQNQEEEKSFDKSPSLGEIIRSSHRMFTWSLSNNALTAFTVNMVRADEMNASLESLAFDTKKKNREQIIEATLGLRSVASTSFDTTWELTKKLIEIKMKKNLKDKVPDYILLNVAISAYRNKRYSFAKYYFDRLLTSKKRQIKAASANMLGIMMIAKKDYTEAMGLFRLALKYQGRYVPSLLNLLFLSMRFGDFSSAKRYIRALPTGWFRNSSQIILDRWSSNPRHMEQTCQRVQSARPKHKPTIYNCALGYYQSLNKPDKAVDLFAKAVKIVDGSSIWDEKIYLLLDKIEMEKENSE